MKIIYSGKIYQDISGYIRIGRINRINRINRMVRISRISRISRIRYFNISWVSFNPEHPDQDTDFHTPPTSTYCSFLFRIPVFDFFCLFSCFFSGSISNFVFSWSFCFEFRINYFEFFNSYRGGRVRPATKIIKKFKLPGGRYVNRGMLTTH